jgi:hypothetical protein
MVTCDPIANASTERLIKQKGLDWARMPRDEFCEILKGWHAQDGIESQFRDGGLLKWAGAKADAAQAARVREGKLYHCFRRSGRAQVENKL